MRERARELDVRTAELRSLAAELEERGDWTATATAALDAQERRAEELDEREAAFQERLKEMTDQERVQGAALRQRRRQIRDEELRLQAN